MVQNEKLQFIEWSFYQLVVQLQFSLVPDGSSNHPLSSYCPPWKPRLPRRIATRLIGLSKTCARAGFISSQWKHRSLESLVQTIHTAILSQIQRLISEERSLELLRHKGNRLVSWNDPNNLSIYQISSVCCWPCWFLFAGLNRIVSRSVCACQRPGRGSRGHSSDISGRSLCLSTCQSIVSKRLITLRIFKDFKDNQSFYFHVPPSSTFRSFSSGSELFAQNWIWDFQHPQSMDSLRQFSATFFSQNSCRCRSSNSQYVPDFWLIMAKLSPFSSHQQDIPVESSMRTLRLSRFTGFNKWSPTPVSGLILGISGSPAKGTNRGENINGSGAVTKNHLKIFLQKGHRGWLIQDWPC